MRSLRLRIVGANISMTIVKSITGASWLPAPSPLLPISYFLFPVLQTGPIIVIFKVNNIQQNQRLPHV